MAAMNYADSSFDLKEGRDHARTPSKPHEIYLEQVIAKEAALSHRHKQAIVKVGVSLLPHHCTGWQLSVAACTQAAPGTEHVRSEPWHTLFSLQSLMKTVYYPTVHRFSPPTVSGFVCQSDVSFSISYEAIC